MSDIVYSHDTENNNTINTSSRQSEMDSQKILSELEKIIANRLKHKRMMYK